MENTNLFTYTLRKNNTYLATLTYNNCLKNIVMPNSYNNKPITKVILSNANGIGSGISKFKFANNVEEIEFRCARGHTYNVSFEEINIPTSLPLLPEFFLEKRFPRLRRIVPEENHPRYKIINNCLVDYVSKTLLLIMNKGTIPESEEVTNISKYAFTKLVNKGATFKLPKNIKHIDNETFSKDRVNVKIEVSEDNLNFKMVDGCLIDLNTKTLLKSFGDNEVINLKDTGIKKITKYAFIRNRHVKKIILPEGLVSIKQGAFFMCTNLEEINLPDSLRVVEQTAFEACTKLKEIKFPDDLIFLDTKELFDGAINLNKITYPKVVKSYLDVYVAKETKMPLIYDYDARLLLCNKRYKEIKIPKDIIDARLLTDNEEVEIKKLTLEGNMAGLEIGDKVNCDEIEFKDKKSEFEFKDHALYLKATKEITDVFIPKNIYEYEVPSYLKLAGHFKIHGGKNLEKITFPKHIKGFGDKLVNMWPQVKYIDILNPNFDFSAIDDRESQVLINVDLTKSKKFEKLAGCIVGKESKEIHGFYSRNHVLFNACDYEEFKKFALEGKLKCEGEFQFIGTKTLKERLFYPLKEAIRENRAFVVVKDELKKVSKDGIEIIGKDIITLKLPAKITTKRKMSLDLIGLGQEEYDDYIELHLPKGITDLSPETISYFYKMKNFNITIDKDNPYYEIENGVFILKDRSIAIFAVPYFIKNKEVRIKEGVKKVDFNIRALEEGSKIYLPSSVETIDFNENYLALKHQVFIDENNKNFYVKDNVIYRYLDNEPLVYTRGY